MPRPVVMLSGGALIAIAIKVAMLLMCIGHGHHHEQGTEQSVAVILKWALQAQSKRHVQLDG